ncbi:Pentatricopeptide repeat-containing protein [Rhynchospora pubera]|uniref:Pentatricopeptide repeat-containing protein n=1 Tax=Rhynchospora pubera TaxID=906938 RepID=A0AAV8E9J5_9POAL|nr:Pentatricopeptide repeat-containing protein [Rhynchospora pubera]
MALLLRPKTSFLRSPSLLKLLSTTTTSTSDSLPSLTTSESKLLLNLHSLLLDHHHSEPSLASSPPPVDLSISSLTSSFSQLTSTAPSPALALELIHRVSSLRHGHPFHQSITFFNWYLSLSPPLATLPDIYTAMIDFSGKLHYFPLAHQLLDKMLALSIPIPSQTIMALVRRYIRAGMPNEAKDLFCRMSDYGHEPDPSFLTTVLGSLAKKRLADEAQSIFDSFKSVISPDVFLYSALINAWCRAGRLDRAEEIFSEMNQAGIVPNVYTYTCIIDAMYRAGQIPRAQELFCQMINSGCSPNTATYNAIMRAHVKAGRTEQVLQVHNDMKRFGCEPDIITYNFLIETQCSKSQGNLDAALKVLNQMVLKKCNPDCHSFNPIFKLLVKSSNIEAVHKLYEKMRGLNVQPNTVTYNLLIELFNKEKKIDMVLRMKKEMEKEGVEPNVNTYSALITAYCERGNWRRASDALMEMVEVKRLKPKDSIYKMVVNLLKCAGQLKKCENLTEMMVKQGFVEKPMENAML